MTFPGPDAGFIAVSDSGAPGPPGFARKKDAKKYAAKCCVEWLMAAGHIRPHGDGFLFLKSKATRQPLPNPSSASTSNRLPPPASSARVTQPGPARPREGVPDDDDANPLSRRVHDMCHNMGMVAPRYVLVPTDEGGCFNGWPDFGVDSAAVPDEVGRVANVYGEKEARHRICEEVLCWLVKEEKKRQDEVDALLKEWENQLM